MFEEHVRSEALAKYSIAPHACVLRFFVEDDTIEVTELPLPNSGRVEKRLVRRHRVRKPGMEPTYGNDDHWSMNDNTTMTSLGMRAPVDWFYGVDDLYVGSVIRSSGMSFRVCVDLFVDLLFLIRAH